MRQLELKTIEAWHGLLPAVRGVSFAVESGQIIGLVGANGAGKTTLLRTIAGAHRCRSGLIFFKEQDITDTAAYRRVRQGISLVPEGRRLFVDMTVEENLRVGCASYREGPWNLEQVAEALPQLKAFWRRKAGHLSGGQQQAVAIGRALMANPELLLLDEISLGLSPKAVDGVYESLATLRTSGTTIILVEQDLRRCMAFVDRVLCMLEGRIVADSLTGATSRSEILEHYFGTHNRQEEVGR